MKILDKQFWTLISSLYKNSQSIQNNERSEIKRPIADTNKRRLKFQIVINGWLENTSQILNDD